MAELRKLKQGKSFTSGKALEGGSALRTAFYVWHFCSHSAVM